MPLSHAANAGRHSFAERQKDLYRQRRRSSLSLASSRCRIEFGNRPAAPAPSFKCCAAPAIRCTPATCTTGAAPIVKSGVDFLTTTKAPPGVECTLTNPPYKCATEFVARAVELTPLVVMLLRFTFMESKRRTPILKSGRLARVHVFRERLPMMHRHGWAGPKASSSIAFAWFVFDRNHTGPTTLDRISWECGHAGPRTVDRTARDRYPNE